VLKRVGEYQRACAGARWGGAHDLAVLTGGRHAWGATRGGGREGTACGVRPGAEATRARPVGRGRARRRPRRGNDLRRRTAPPGAGGWGEIAGGQAVGWEGGGGETGSGTQLEWETLTLTRVGTSIYIVICWTWPITQGCDSN
jgi:hypothetical protein